MSLRSSATSIVAREPPSAARAHVCPVEAPTPVAIIRAPRERMVGSGIASSVFHEVGHQAAALLGLVESLRPELREMAHSNPQEREAWALWERWISEIVADFWSVARVGVAATMGLMAVVSLPRAFVFRLDARDPHPTPWIRVKLSSAMGRALYPMQIWDQLIDLWESYYPPSGLDPKDIAKLSQCSSAQYPRS